MTSCRPCKDTCPAGYHLSGSCDGSGIEQLISPECAELIAIELKKTPKPWAEMPLR